MPKNIRTIKVRAWSADRARESVANKNPSFVVIDVRKETCIYKVRLRKRK